MGAMRCCRQAGVGTAARRSVGARDANDEGSFKRVVHLHLSFSPAYRKRSSASVRMGMSRATNNRSDVYYAC